MRRACAVAGKGNLLLVVVLWPRRRRCLRSGPTESDGQSHDERGGVFATLCDSPVA